ncbi:bifunctional phosphoribosyl-AMP cyclohydrolase/phosphoribosyl-ATP diphosphatase HisIE [Desulforamulus ruminis]|uniref:Histidine biosynthesis bifunctional protein HisIE n=1 Tax=Desulforamulus ruminis (strain ATCC 23193 / DSM 2154 / NCIMB 8452 / DL) TaxID=696281 RepID=F6DPJ3_DESRL|nr:bifunctional phosphoribosyl-AMP cyclohydrolase/phosphoribosyl-ATP diphosphatase HisIE [Desulforamulus ruminis]AEG59570.1 phosphoribosyl-ATP diphosphatase [Desulforamulus ruminis DSM 2154]
MIFKVDDLKYNEAGLIPAIVQEVRSREVLMMAWMNQEAVEKTLATGETWFYSRSRQAMWKKGETSGHVQRVKGLYYDCDADTLLVLAEQEGGAACHEGYTSCFHNRVNPDRSVSIEGEKKFEPAQVYGGQEARTSADPEIINDLFRVILSRKAERPEGAYTTYLFDQGVDKICKKVGEECAEVIIGAKNNSKEELTYEAADLMYHLLVLLANQGISPEEIYRELAKRRK